MRGVSTVKKSPRIHTMTGFPAAAIRFVRALERNREAIAIRHGLSPSELRALFWIGEKGSVRPKELAEHMEMTTGGVTAISHRLVELGLLERIAHPEDRRSLFLELTAGGHTVMTDMHSDFLGMIAGSTTMLDTEQLADFEYALSVVADEVFARMER
jgi:DNA-binding MarR family transcriptional regulator